MNCLDQEVLLENVQAQVEGRPPAPALMEHLSACDQCLREFQELQQDQCFIAETHERAASSNVTAPWTKPPAAFRLVKGILRSIQGLKPVWTVPVFRSDGPGRTVIYSTLLPMEEDYVIVELSGDEQSDLRLLLEKGAKNGPGPRISLYTNSRPMDKRQLQDRIIWNVGTFSPGRYELFLEDKQVLRFNVE